MADQPETTFTLRGKTTPERLIATIREQAPQLLGAPPQARCSSIVIAALLAKSSLMSTAEVAAYLTVTIGVKVSEGTLRQWRHRGTGPESFPVGRRRYYRPEAVDAWLAECEHAGMEAS